MVHRVGWGRSQTAIPARTPVGSRTVAYYLGSRRTTTGMTRPRRRWREGDRLRGTRCRRPHPGRRAGPMRRSPCNVCERWHAGTDGLTWGQYEADLEDRIPDLHRRVHLGTYRAQPSRRSFIPKADGRMRPLGIAALEDKIVQQAVVTVLNQIYEVDFL